MQLLRPKVPPQDDYIIVIMGINEHIRKKLTYPLVIDIDPQQAIEYVIP